MPLLLLSQASEETFLQRMKNRLLQPRYVSCFQLQCLRCPCSAHCVLCFSFFHNLPLPISTKSLIIRPVFRLTLAAFSTSSASRRRCDRNFHRKSWTSFKRSGRCAGCVEEKGQVLSPNDECKQSALVLFSFTRIHSRTRTCLGLCFVFFFLSLSLLQPL